MKTRYIQASFPRAFSDRSVKTGSREKELTRLPRPRVPIRMWKMRPSERKVYELCCIALIECAAVFVLYISRAFRPRCCCICENARCGPEFGFAVAATSCTDFCWAWIMRWYMVMKLFSCYVKIRTGLSYSLRIISVTSFYLYSRYFNSTDSTKLRIKLSCKKDRNRLIKKMTENFEFQFIYADVWRQESFVYRR